jgi:hypothetical protein
MDAFNDFTFGSGDENIGERSKRFKGESGRTYRVSFVWFDSYDEDGAPAEGANLKFTGCQRIYKDGVGYIAITDANRAAMMKVTGGTPKQQIATVICVWPCDKDGELDVASFKNGKGWKVQPWTFSPMKYKTIGQNNRRFPLTKHDLSMLCSDAQYQKMTFTPEGESLLLKYLGSKNENIRAVAAKILSDARAVAENIHGELARNMTVDEVREKLGGEMSSPTGNHTDKNVDSMLDDIDLGL